MRYGRDYQLDNDIRAMRYLYRLDHKHFHILCEAWKLRFGRVHKKVKGRRRCY